MEKIVIADTDVVIDFFSGSFPFAVAVADLIKKDRLAVTAITVYELYAGILGAKRLRQIEAFVENIPVMPLGTVEAAWAGRIYTELKSQGKMIGNQDILIAGICLANSLPFLTRNAAHFESIKGLEIIRI